MCGRYVIHRAPEEFRRLYGYPEQPNFPPRYNVAPTQPVPVVLQERDRRQFRLVRWGFLPSWVKDPKVFPLVINARAETLSDKPTFRAALKRRRCVFLADAFYEWRREGKARAPYLIRRRDGGPLPFAGLWETYHDATGSEIDTAAIVTTDANGALSAVHDRMPVILGADQIAPWLDADGTDADEALALARPCPEDWLELFPVSSRVNKVANDDAALMERVPREDAGRPDPAPRRARPRSSDEDDQGALF